MELDYSELPTLISTERIRNLSMTSIGFNAEDLSEEDSWEFLVENLNFNEYMRDKKNKGLGFYRMLELSSKGMIKATQDEHMVVS